MTQRLETAADLRIQRAVGDYIADRFDWTVEHVPPKDWRRLDYVFRADGIVVAVGELKARQVPIATFPDFRFAIRKVNDLLLAQRNHHLIEGEPIKAFAIARWTDPVLLWIDVADIHRGMSAGWDRTRHNREAPRASGHVGAHDSEPAVGIPHSAMEVIGGHARL